MNLQNLIGQHLILNHLDGVSWNVPTEIRLLDTLREMRYPMRVVGILTKADKFSCAFVQQAHKGGRKTFMLTSFRGAQRIVGGTDKQNALFEASEGSVKFLAETPEALLQMLLLFDKRPGLQAHEMYTYLYVGHPYRDPRSAMDFSLVIPQTRTNWKVRLGVWVAAGVFTFAGLCVWNAVHVLLK